MKAEPRVCNACGKVIDREDAYRGVRQSVTGNRLHFYHEDMKACYGYMPPSKNPATDEDPGPYYYEEKLVG